MELYVIKALEKDFSKGIGKRTDTGEEQMRNNARHCWSTEEEAVWTEWLGKQESVWRT